MLVLGVFRECDRLLATINLNVDLEEYEYDNREVIRRLIQRHVNLPFHQACFSTSITPSQGIEGCFQAHGIERSTEVDGQQMTALHILCANPHVTGGAIRYYLQLALDAAANAQHSSGKTGLHILCSSPYQDNSTGDAIRSYLNLAPDATNVQYSNGKYPFQYLWNSNDTFLDDRNVSTLMAW